MNKWLERIWTMKSDRVTISARRRGSQLAWVRLPTPIDCQNLIQMAKDDGETGGPLKQKFDCEKYEYMINV